MQAAYSTPSSTSIMIYRLQIPIRRVSVSNGGTGKVVLLGLLIKPQSIWLTTTC